MRLLICDTSIDSKTLEYRSQCSSGSSVARLPAAREIPGSNRAAYKSLLSRKSLRYAALGTGYTLTAVPRSTQPPTPRGTLNEYQPYG